MEGPRTALWRDRIVTAEWVYGTVLVMALITAGAPDDDEPGDPGETLAVVLSTVVVFWIAHAYAEAVARYGRAGQRGGIGEAIRAAARHSLGLLGAAVLPSIAVVLAVTGTLDFDSATDIALLLGLAVLAVSSAWTFIVRGARWWTTVIGTVVSVLIGMVVVLLDFLLH